MTPTEHAQLLRELAISADHHAAQLQGQAYSRNWAQQTRDLATRARQAADEIEGRKTPPQIPVPPAWLVESWRQGWRPADDSLGGFGTYMARESAAWGYQQGITQTEAQAQTAGEIEGRRVPTDEEIEQLAEPFQDDGFGKAIFDDVAFARAVLARFGGGEGQHG